MKKSLIHTRQFATAKPSEVVIEYYLIEQDESDPISYGVEISKKEFFEKQLEIAFAYNACNHKDTMLDFINILAKNEVSPTHLKEVLDDNDIFEKLKIHEFSS